MKNVLALLLLTVPVMATSMILEDFQDRDGTGWRYVSDRVMGGVSDGQAALGQDGDIVYAHLTGAVSTANNGGFVQIRRDLSNPLPDDSTAISLMVRGNGEVYYVHLRTTQSRRPWQYFAAPFPTTADWQTVTLNWSDFAATGRGFDAQLAPADIISIGVVAYGRDHAADVSVAEIAID